MPTLADIRATSASAATPYLKKVVGGYEVQHKFRNDLKFALEYVGRLDLLDSGVSAGTVCGSVADGRKLLYQSVDVIAQSLILPSPWQEIRDEIRRGVYTDGRALYGVDRALFIEAAVKAMATGPVQVFLHRRRSVVEEAVDKHITDLYSAGCALHAAVDSICATIDYTPVVEERAALAAQRARELIGKVAPAPVPGGEALHFTSSKTIKITPEPKTPKTPKEPKMSILKSLASTMTSGAKFGAGLTTSSQINGILVDCVSATAVSIGVPTMIVNARPVQKIARLVVPGLVGAFAHKLPAVGGFQLPTIVQKGAKLAAGLEFERFFTPLAEEIKAKLGPLEKLATALVTELEPEKTEEPSVQKTEEPPPVEVPYQEAGDKTPNLGPIPGSALDDLYGPGGVKGT